MRLHVRHQTKYRYSAPISYAIQSLRLEPTPYDGLKIHYWRVQGDDRRSLPSFVDGLGNIVHCHTVIGSHIEASIIVDGEVETHGEDGIVRGAPETLPPLFYLRATPLTVPDPTIAALAAETARGRNEIDRLHALMNGVRDRMEYRPGTTDATTSAVEALARREGVCQDHAHVFIAAARSLGVPARYVSGYLWTGDDQEGASHAWAEAYVREIGWIGFDPANRICPTETYVRVAIGLDYWAAAPVRGLRQGYADEALSVKVQVQRAGADQ